MRTCSMILAVVILMTAFLEAVSLFNVLILVCLVRVQLHHGARKQLNLGVTFQLFTEIQILQRNKNNFARKLVSCIGNETGRRRSQRDLAATQQQNGLFLVNTISTLSSAGAQRDVMVVKSQTQQEYRAMGFQDEMHIYTMPDILVVHIYVATSLYLQSPKLLQLSN